MVILCIIYHNFQLQLLLLMFVACTISRIMHQFAFMQYGVVLIYVNCTCYDSISISNSLVNGIKIKGYEN